MKKKLKLNDLNVQSFITDANQKGGAKIDLTAVVSGLTCNSIHACPTLPLDQCPTYGGTCPTVNVNCITVDGGCPTVDVKCGTDPVRGCINTRICTVADININM